MRKKAISIICMLMMAFSSASAQAPNNSGTYYRAANGKSGQALKTALSDIITTNKKKLGYSSLNDYYSQTDLRSDGKLWDMYSDKTNYTISDTGTGTEGVAYNKEHSVPKSWFNSASPMYSDIFHIVPVDSWVNSMRSNYPFGETSHPTKISHNAFSKLGPCNSDIGYSGTVFEPNNEYKGDFARIYFYMVTCYEKEITSSTWGGGMFQGGAYPAFTSWALNMLMRWSKEDPVSQKEIDRNNAVYKIQKNRNPFVDYPGLEEYIWGDKTNITFEYDNYTGSSPEIVSTPSISPVSGTYTTEQTVTITCSTSDASIYYTTDGTTPSVNSTLYINPFTVSEDCIIKAIAVVDDESSHISSVIYTFKEGGDISEDGIIWAEDWQKAGISTNVANIENPTAIYSSGDNGNYTKTYSDNYAGGESPELLIPKSTRNSYFMASIALNGIGGNLTLTFNANNDNINLTTTVTGVTISNPSYFDNVYTYTINVPVGIGMLDLKFETTTDRNTRVDNFKLKGQTKVEPDLLPVTLAFSVMEVNVELGNDFTEPTLTITPSDANITVTYSSDNVEVATVDATTGKVTIVGEGTANIIASFNGDNTYMAVEDAAYMLTVTKTEVPPVTGDGIYAKISNTDELETGKKYLLVYEETPVAYAGIDGNKGLPGNVMITENKINLNDAGNEANVLVLELSSNGKWFIKDSEKYLAFISSGNNSLTTQSSATDSGTEWIISFTKGNAYINNASSTEYYLQYNTSATCFRCYKGTQKYPALYKEIVTDSPERLLGDVNGDGLVNIADVVTIVSYILGDTPEVFYEDAADMNEDGEINITDAVKLVENILNE